MFYKALERKIEEFPKTKWDDGLITLPKGHTRQVVGMSPVHCSRLSTAWYETLILGGRLDEKFGLEILNAVEKLQCTDKNHWGYGCSRWYSEEVYVNDTNAAFFTQLPLLQVMIFDRALVPDSHAEVIERMFRLAVHWYEREIDNPSYYYTNKMVSDGTMFLGISKINGDTVRYEKALKFFEIWLDYTENKGWGHGENMSAGYNSVIFASLKTAVLTLGESEREQRIKAGLLKVMEEQKALFRYFKGYEFTPAIRNYNFEGRARRKELVTQISGHGAELNLLAGTYLWEFITFAYPFKNELKEEADSLPEKDIDIRTTRIYKDTFGYSCVMKNGSIGSINKFPVIESAYQFKTIGIGWQSMPVNFCIYEGEVGYLRRIVRNEETVMCHPMHAFLSPCLFSDAPYPEVLTRSKQEKNVLITKRTVEKVNNMVGEISDELYIPSFSGEYKQITVNGREWVAIRYKKATVFVSATMGIVCPKGTSEHNEHTARTVVPLTVTLEDKKLSVKQTSFKSEEVIRYRAERNELGWIMIYEDERIEDIESYLSEVEVSERSYKDGFEPRYNSHFLHEITVKKNGETVIEYTYDPYI